MTSRRVRLQPEVLFETAVRLKVHLQLVMLSATTMTGTKNTFSCWPALRYTYNPRCCLSQVLANLKVRNLKLGCLSATAMTSTRNTLSCWTNFRHVLQPEMLPATAVLSTHKSSGLAPHEGSSQGRRPAACPPVRKPSSGRCSLT